MRKPKKADARELLKTLTASAKIKVQPLWQDAADAVLENGMVSANAWSVTVPKKKGEETFEIEDDWWKELYAFLAPSLEPWDRVMVAKAILQNKVFRAGCNEWEEWDTAWWLLCQDFDGNDDKHLTQLVKKKGFKAIAKEMTERLAAYRLTNPRIRATPKWDGTVLKWKTGEWTFRNQHGGICKAVLDFLKANKWKRGTVESLLESQVTDAAKYLRRKTRPLIDWKASADGQITPIF